MNNIFFISGIGTDVGKTLVAAIITEALGASYWKPVQAGYEHGTDALTVNTLISDPAGRIYPETYRLAMAASPHIAAAAEHQQIDTERIKEQFNSIVQANGDRPLVIEGAGGLLVPLNEKETVADLAAILGTRLILVSRNYLGSINHSRLTAAYCKYSGLHVAGWVFSDQYMNYEQEIVQWTGYPMLGSIPFLAKIDPAIIQREAARIAPALKQLLFA